MKEITFEGIISGDHECFCWDVTREVYKEITGNIPSKWDKSTFNKGGKKQLYRLYPGAILDALGVNSNAKCKVTISAESVGEKKSLPIVSHEDLIRTIKKVGKLEKSFNKIIKRVGKRLGSDEAAELWLNIVDISSGKTPRQMIVDGQLDVLEAMLDDQEGPSPSYS